MGALTGMGHVAYIGLGSNLGDRSAAIAAAVEALRSLPGIQSVTPSGVRETVAVGGPPGQPAFLNAAARVETELGPHELLREMLAIETRLGRERHERWGPRTIDLDLLLYDDDMIHSPALIIPHPRMHERLFVLEPLAEVGGGAVHPLLGVTVGAMLQERLREGGAA